MSFWNLSDNSALQSDGQFEMGGGEPIPANTALKVMITEASWDEYQGDRHIKIRWDVIDGEYKNRVVFQKVRVMEPDPKKRDRAIKMLAAIDANAGGKLMALGREPTDMELASSLLNRPMWIKVQVWEMDGKAGNWVSAVSGGNSGGAVHTPAQSAAPVQQPVAGGFHDPDSIPF